jgi:hypothetical protein
MALCVLVDKLGDIWTSTNPSSRTPSWKKTAIPKAPGARFPPGLTGISCPSVSFCVAVDEGGSIYVSTDPTGSASHWPRVFSEPRALDHGFDAVTCVSVTLCVATDNGGDVATSLHPTIRGAHWTLSHVTRGNQGKTEALESVSCPTDSFCVIVSSYGQAYVSRDPGDPVSWKGAHIDTDTAVYGDNDYGESLESVTCPTISLCLAADADGNVLSTTDPTQATPWKSDGPIGTAAEGTANVLCLSTTLCLFADRIVLLSQDPTGNASTWQPSGGLAWPTAVACSPPSLCILTYDNGDVVTGSLSG